MPNIPQPDTLPPFEQHTSPYWEPHCFSIDNIAPNEHTNWETLATASTDAAWGTAIENNNHDIANENANDNAEHYESHNEELRGDEANEEEEVGEQFETVNTDDDGEGSAAWGSQDNFDEAWGESVDWGTAQNVESPEQEVNIVGI